MLQQFGEIGFENKKKTTTTTTRYAVSCYAVSCYAVTPLRTRYTVTGFANDPSFTVALVVGATSIKLKHA